MTRSQTSPVEATSLRWVLRGAMLLVLTSVLGACASTAPSEEEVSFCGNGIVEPGETCDDGNTRSGDGCSSDCQVEPGWTCVGEPSRCSRGGPPPTGSSDDGRTGGAGSSTPSSQPGPPPSGSPPSGGPPSDGPPSGGPPSGGPPSGSPPSDGPPSGGPGPSDPGVDRCAGVVCTDLDTNCGRGVCDAATGQCVLQAFTNGVACDDGDRCTLNTTCQNGTCVGTQRDCSTFGGPCSVGACDPATGTCRAQPRNDGDTCGDGDACSAEVCQAGECVSQPVEEGTACGTATECGREVCRGGSCVAETYDDCTSCDGGSSFCVGGRCGGPVATTTFTFAEPQVPPVFTTSGNQPWGLVEVSGASGGRALRAGNITHNQRSSLFLDVEVREGASVAFRVRVSSEATFDPLVLLVDGVERDRWSGEVAWTTVTVPLTAGSREIEWRYTKDGSVNRGSDTAWIDDVVVTGIVDDRCDGPCGAGVFDGEDCVVCAPEPDGTLCAEGDACTVGECAAGECVIVPDNEGTTCADGDACTIGRCTEGECAIVPDNDGGFCADGDECTVGECIAGACEIVPANEGDFCGDPDDPCRVGTCTEGGCLVENVPNDTPCLPDAPVCQTASEGLCQDGTCVGTVTPQPDCAACPDGTCAGGVCRPFYPLFDRLGPDRADDPRWTTGGNGAWGILPGGGPAGETIAVSGNIGNSQQTWLETVVSVPQAGTLHFLVDVSSEPGSSGGLYDSGYPGDWAEFYVDGQRVDRWQGEVRWRAVSVPLQPGQRTLRWRYVKDSSAVRGRDDFRVANIRLDMRTASCTAAEASCDIPLFHSGQCLICPDPVCD